MPDRVRHDRVLHGRPLPGRHSTTWLAIALACSLLGSCAGSDLDLNPFYLGRVEEGSDRTLGESPNAGRSSSITLGPLWDDAEANGHTVERALHPLWRYVRDENGTRVQILHPLFQWRENDRLTEWRILPFEWYRDHHPADQPSEWDLMLLPFLFAGGGSPGERSFALFPLGGKVRAFAGFAEFDFVLFPLYYRVHKDITAPETFHNVTPLIGWTSGGPREKSFRVLPFFARWSWEGRSERYSVLWPIVHWQTYGLDTDDPSKLLAVWPLFKVDHNRTHRFLTFLWPFFRYNVETPVAHRAGPDGEDVPGERYHRIDFPWPLFRSERTRDFERTRLFPFYSHYHSEELDSDAYAIPFVWKRTSRGLDTVTHTFDVAPIFHRKTIEHQDGRPDAHATRVWPLFGHEDDGMGGSQLEVPVLSPIDIPRYTEDFVANWGPWFRLYRDRRRPNGDRDLEMLFRFVQYHREAERTRWSVPFVYSGDAREGRTTHDLLLGLLRFGTGRGGLELRLFGLPLLRPSRSSP